MQVERVNTNSTFNGFYNNKAMLKMLELTSDNGALLVAGTSTLLSAIVRPISILATPKADKENKQYACAKSIASGVIGFGLAALVSTPIVKGIQNIQNEPKKFLTVSAINSLSENNKTLSKSAAFIFSSQILKLGSAIITTIPKAFLTCALIPPVVSFFFNKKQEKTNNISFKGNIKSSLGERLTDKISAGIGRIFNNDKVQTFSNKYKNTNFAQHIFNINDILATALFAKFTMNNKNIKENKKKALVYNASIMTTISVVGGYFVNALLKKPTDKFIEKIKQANASSPKLEKYITGAKIAKPAMILGCMYYIIAPMFATLMSDILTIRGDKCKR